MISIRQDEPSDLEDYEESGDYSHREFRTPWASGNPPRTSRRMQPDYRARIFDKPLDFHRHRPAAWPHTFANGMIKIKNPIATAFASTTTILFLVAASSLGVLMLDHRRYWGGLSEEMSEHIMLDKGDPMGPYIILSGMTMIFFGLVSVLFWGFVWYRRRTRRSTQ